MSASDSESNVIKLPAELYEEFFVPAVLQEWAKLVAGAAKIESGQRALDVACGTGILARTVAEHAGPHGAVVGIDPSAGMLTVARRKAPAIEWREGRAEELPFEANSFDVVVSQFGLMFFADRRRAIQEMMRVLRPRGQLTVAVWDSVENCPGYADLAQLLQRHYGDDVVKEFLPPFSLGNAERLALLFDDAGVVGATVTRQVGTARYPSLRDWLEVEVKEWLLGERMDDAEFEEFLAQAQETLEPFVTDKGTVVLAAPGYIVTATKA